MTAQTTDELPVLDGTEQRILGCLLEKQVTVPASYPLTVSAIRSAANQTSSRTPVTDYDDATLIDALKVLKDRDLVRTVWAGKGSRTLKYHQLLEERLALNGAEKALIAVLLLRGEQTAGELRTRSDRLHSFADRAQVEACLTGLAGHGLARELPRRPGQQDHRWVHLLGSVPSLEQDPIMAPAPDREVVLADGVEARDARVRAGWDASAAVYADRTEEELTRQPFEIWLLERFASLVRLAPAVEVGCGPGHIAAFLADAGVDISGVDLAPAMIGQARRRYPDLKFSVGDQAKLLRPATARGWGGIVSFYSTIHLAASELATTFGAWHRVLDEGGWLLLAMTPGQEVRALDSDLAGGPIETVHLVLHDPDEILQALAGVNFTDLEWYRRGPYDGETEPDRLFVLCRA